MCPHLQRIGVVEEFDSIQGEGSRAGRQTVFVRLAGCNLRCSWCDTDHRARREVDADRIASIAIAGKGRTVTSVCLTGGEPGIHGALLTRIAKDLKDRQVFVQVETNGLVLEACSPEVFDLITVSPKLYLGEQEFRNTIRMARDAASSTSVEVKVVVGSDVPVWFIRYAEAWGTRNIPLFVQPEWGEVEEATRKCLDIVKSASREQVRLGVQLHKILNVQ